MTRADAFVTSRTTPATLDYGRDDTGMPNRDLFRPEARLLRGAPLSGGIVLARPVSATVFALLGGACAAFVLGLLLFGSYTERTTVSGELHPEGSKLQARLHVPSSAIAFVDSGAPVLLRYDADPHRRFGRPVGIVASVEPVAAPLAPDAEGRTDRGRGFRVTVDLPSQTLHAAGRDLPLYPGMPLHAEILHEKRRFWDWVFNPVRTTRENAIP